LPRLSEEGISKPPPRKVVKVVQSGDDPVQIASLFVIIFILVCSIMAGSVFLRLAAISFGETTVGTPLGVSKARYLKSSKTTNLELSFVTNSGEKITKGFPIHPIMSSRASRPDLEDKLSDGVTVAYIPSLPWISGLVDDFGYTQWLFKLLMALALMMTLIAGWVISLYSRQRRLLTNGIVLPFTVKPAFLGTVWVSYQYNDKTYSKRVVVGRVSFAVKFEEGLVLVIDPSRPKRFLIYGEGPWRCKN
jgi:hypothetical protein